MASDSKSNEKNIRSMLKQFWQFLWYEDSLLSWTVNIILAFILIKFIIYPGIGGLLGTQLPVVAVISESMEHPGGFEQWWVSPAQCGEETFFYASKRPCTQEEWYAQYNIGKEEFKVFPLSNGFNKGDIIILRGTSYENVDIGDVIVFDSKMEYPVIHRVVYKNDFIATKGDHNAEQLVKPEVNERYITKDQVIGEAWIRIPYLGYVKILAVQAVRCVGYYHFNGCVFG